MGSLILSGFITWGFATTSFITRKFCGGLVCSTYTLGIARGSNASKATTKNPLNDWQIGKCRHPKIQNVSHGRHRGSALRWKKNELDNAPFQDVLLIENGDFPIAMLVCQVLNIVSLGPRSLEEQIVILWFYQFQLLAANSAMVINPIFARVISSSFECHLVTSQDHYPLCHP